MLHAWYSHRQRELSGIVVYRSAVDDDKVVVATEISRDRDYPGAWPDVEYCGPVTEYVRRAEPLHPGLAMPMKNPI